MQAYTEAQCLLQQQPVWNIFHVSLFCLRLFIFYISYFNTKNYTCDFKLFVCIVVLISNETYTCDKEINYNSIAEITWQQRWQRRYRCWRLYYQAVPTV